MARYLFRSVFLLVVVNLLVKPVWIFGVDRNVQVFTGYEAYGVYFSYFSFTVIFNIVADAGITLYVQQKLAAHYQGGSWLCKAIRYKVFMSVVYAMFAGALGWLLGLQDLVLLSGLVLLQLLLSWISFSRAVLSARQQFTASSFLSVLDKLLIILPALWLFYVVFNGERLTIYTFAWWQVLSATITLAVGLLLMYRLPSLTGEPSVSQLSLQDIVAESLPFAMVVFFMFLHARADGVLLHLYAADKQQQAGQYAAMFRFVDAATVLSYLAAGFLLSFWAKHLQDPQVIRDTIDKMFRIMLAGAVLVCVVFFFYSNQLQEWMYHTQDATAASLLQWGIWVLIPYFLVDIFGTLLTAHKKLSAIIVIVSVCAVVNILLNLFFIPVYGAQAAALIAILTQSLFAVGLMIVSAREWNMLPSGSSFLRVLILLVMTAVTAIVVARLPLSPVLQLAVLSLFWLVLVFVLRLFSLRWFVEWQKEV